VEDRPATLTDFGRSVNSPVFHGEAGREGSLRRTPGRGRPDQQRSVSARRHWLAAQVSYLTGSSPEAERNDFSAEAVPAGGLAQDRSGWIAASPRFFLPVRVLSRVFRGKFAAGLKQIFDQDKLSRAKVSVTGKRHNVPFSGRLTSQIH
jgi:hypothetical protein